MTFVCISPNCLKKSITANGNWGNGYTWHGLSDYHDELKPFLHVIRKHGTANERAGQNRGSRLRVMFYVRAQLDLMTKLWLGRDGEKNHPLSY